MKRRSGFTLIELILVIVILGIIAGVVLPKFVNFKTQATEKSEEGIVGAINSALKIYQTSYIVAGGDPATYPSINPFSLLVQAPPFAAYFTSPDNVTWRFVENVPFTAWYLHCPHWDGPVGGGSVTYKGSFYVYQYGTSGVWGHQPGDFWRWGGRGHTY